MKLTLVFLLIAVSVGCFALPTTDKKDDLSIFFDHTSPGRIVGGTVAAEASAPHMVALSSGVLIRSFLCGGSIISTRTVLTAAHCIDAVFSFGSLASSLRGTIGTNRWNLGGDSYSFARNVTHPNYLSNIIKNDIGLLITATSIIERVTVSPISVSFNFVDGGVPVRTTGWGRTAAGGSLSTQLLQLDKWIIDGQQCIDDVAQASVNFNMNAPPVEPHIELCTFHSAGHGTCNGDSGSALIRTDTLQQVGIVSWGFPCARGAPDMFVRVSAYRDWLIQNAV